MLLKGSFQNISEWRIYDYLEFMFSLVTLEGNLSATYVNKLLQKQFVNMLEKRPGHL